MERPAITGMSDGAETLYAMLNRGVAFSRSDRLNKPFGSFALVAHVQLLPARHATPSRHHRSMGEPPY